MLAKRLLQELISKYTIRSEEMRWGQRGIDMLVEVDICGVDHYAMIKTTVGPDAELGMTLDGREGSWGWAIGVHTGRNRLLDEIEAQKGVDKQVKYKAILAAWDEGRVEMWEIHVDEYSFVTVYILGPDGKRLPSHAQVSTILRHYRGT